MILEVSHIWRFVLKTHVKLAAVMSSFGFPYIHLQLEVAYTKGLE